MSGPRGWDPAANELADYFLTSESVNGLSSSWAPLVGIATGGAVTSVDPESRVTDRRFRLGDSLGKVGHHREVRRVLMALPRGEPSAFDVLWVAHGPTPWQRVFDEGLGKGTAQKIGDHIDSRLLGVSLLTREVREATASWRGPELLRADDRAVGAWLADLSLLARSRRVEASRRAASLALLSEVGRSARALLAGAEDAYRSVRGVVVGTRRAVTRRPRRIDDEGIGF